jgi:uncharacterized protein RhaS with RHS repeats
MQNGTDEYNIFRWYRAGWGQYTQADPIGTASDSNVLRYVASNPTSLTDPLGLFCTKDFVAHYLGRSGTPINLANVGLLSTFLASSSVSSTLRNERQNMIGDIAREARKLCKNCDRGIKSGTWQPRDGSDYVNPYLDGTPCVG